MKFSLICVVFLNCAVSLVLSSSDAFDFGLLGPEAYTVIIDSCKKDLEINKEARNNLMSKCIYPTIRESTINFPHDFIATLERIEFDCWDRRGDFCIRSERIQANHCAIPILTSKGIRYHLFWQSNKHLIRAAFGEKSDCIASAIEQAND